MIDIDYLASGPVRRAFIRFKRRLKSLPRDFASYMARLPGRAARAVKRIPDALAGYARIFARGDFFTRLSFLIMGAGCIRRRRFAKGLLYLAVQLVFWFYFLNSGIYYIRQAEKSLAAMSRPKSGTRTRAYSNIPRATTLCWYCCTA